ncbi:Uric acid permease PucK [compost metagenome]
MLIGLSLIPTGIKNMAGGNGSKDFGSLDNLALSFWVLVFILLHHPARSPERASE